MSRRHPLFWRRVARIAASARVMGATRRGGACLSTGASWPLSPVIQAAKRCRRCARTIDLLSRPIPRFCGATSNRGPVARGRPRRRRRRDDHVEGDRSAPWSGAPGDAALMGHGDEIAIVDANFPAHGSNARVIRLTASPLRVRSTPCSRSCRSTTSFPKRPGAMAVVDIPPRSCDLRGISANQSRRHCGPEAAPCGARTLRLLRAHAAGVCRRRNRRDPVLGNLLSRRVSSRPPPSCRDDTPDRRAHSTFLAPRPGRLSLASCRSAESVGRSDRPISRRISGIAHRRHPPQMR